MEVLTQTMYEPHGVPSSPALTNPDMILPYLPRSRSSTPTGRAPLDAQHPKMAPTNWYAGLFNGMGEVDQARLESARPGQMFSGSTKVSRPHLPGSWQTEEDLYRVNEGWTNDEVNLATSHIPRDAASNEDHELSNNTLRSHMILPTVTHHTARALSPNSSEQGIQQTYGEPPDVGGALQAPSSRTSSQPPSEHEDGDTYSHAAEILANAKKKLTAMEGNLTRARSLSVAAFGARSFNPRIATNSPRTETPAHQGHQRSSSAMSSVRLDSEYEDRDGLSPLHSLANTPAWAINRSISLGSHHHGLLEALREGDDATSFRSSMIEEQPSTILAISPPSSDRMDLSKQVRKARSRIELQDLQERIQTLNGTASLMIRDIQQNKLQRRSLQTLKTPSPFTVSRERSKKIASPLQSPQILSNHQEAVNLEIRRVTTNGFSAISEPTTLDEDDNSQDDNGIEDRRTNQDHNDLCEPFPNPYHEDDESQLAPASPKDPPSFFPPQLPSHHTERSYPSSPEPTSLTLPAKHEDRPDAFNYASFFIHSRTGTFSRISPPPNPITSTSSVRRSSQSSASSADTTKAASPTTTHTTSYLHPRAKHSRQNSNTSISTVNTFATAVEMTAGADADVGEAGEEEDFDLVLPQQPYRPVTTNLPEHQRRTAALPSPRHSTLLSTLLTSAPLAADDSLVVTDILRTLQIACRDLVGEHGEAEGVLGTRTLAAQEWRLRLDEAACALTRDLEEGVYRG